TDFVYVGEERIPGDGIKEFNISTGQLTRYFNLTPWMQGPDNDGLESLTFVPDSTNPEGGLFYAGLQLNSNIYVFQLPIKSSATDTHVTCIGMFNPVGGRSNLSGLDFDPQSGIMYAIWSYGQKKIMAMYPDGTNIVEWDLAGSGDDMEGVALWPGLTPGQAQIFIAEDNGSASDIWRYDFNSMLDITITGNGSVDIVPDPPSYYGTFDTLTAVPDSGYYFVQWSGDLTGSDNPAMLLMDYDKDVTATFEPVGVSETYIAYAHGSMCLRIEPNPFSKLTKVSFSIGHPDRINNTSYGTGSAKSIGLRIFDAAGRLVRDLSNSLPHAPCAMQVSWTGRDDQDRVLPAGVYFVQLTTDEYSETKKILLVR
ncbi:T9SS type A sorting domain-containing protein, partial [candidate division WOR-3 bacterium]|nr:T9SS type A sorting domain-containing protein [candidate division WOR-3 bacterium]